MFPIEGVRDFAAEFPDKIRLTEFDTAGFTLFQSHSDQVIKTLAEIAVAASVEASPAVQRKAVTTS